MIHQSKVQLLAVVAGLLFAVSANGGDTVPSPATNGIPAPHTHGTSAELIRHHRLKHLEARLTVDPAVLREQCRYESEISTAPPARKVVLTFDDGPEPGQTELILETLKRYNIPAVFFLVGHKVQEHPELVKRIRAAGQHVIGNHSWDHPNFHVIDAGAQALEVEKTRDILPTTAGPNNFRYPFGNSTCETNALVRSMGYDIIGWHIDSCDWAFDRSGAVDVKEALICGVLPQHRQDYVGHVVSAVRAHKGGIVLMHEIHPSTVRQLEKIIVAILAEGYAFTSIEDPEFSASLR
jgi:peptidoglycan/xylan/chitin deacetylase (PgdA/CDA1 family)